MRSGISQSIVALFLVLFVDYSHAQQKALRPLTVDDSLRLERLADDSPFNIPVAFSPDGDLAAYSVRRSPGSAMKHAEIYGKDSDIWLVSLTTYKTINLTGGSVDGASSFNPVWSPDGQHLAFVSTRGEGEFSKIWVWDKNSNQKKLVGGRPVQIDPLVANIYWLSNTELIYFSRTRAAYGLRTETPASIWDSSQKVVGGRENTASILNSGTDTNVAFERKISVVSDDRLADAVHVDVAKGSSKQLTQKMCGFPYPSPDRSKIACLSRAANQYGNLLQIIDKSGTMILPQDNTFGSVDWYGRMSEPTWSPTGQKLSFVATDAKGDPQSIYIFNLISKQLKKLPHDRLSFPEIKANSVWPSRKMFKVRWLTDDKIAVYASESSIRLHASGTFDSRAVNVSDSKSRMDWWLIDAAGNTTNLTSKIPEAPAEIFVEEGNSSFVGLSDGRLWRITADGSDPVRLFHVLPQPIAGLPFGTKNADATAVIAIGQPVNGEASYYLLDLKSGRFKQVKKPKQSAELRAFSNANGFVFFAADDRDGSYLWLVNGDQAAARLIHEANTFLKEIDDAKMRPFEYRNGDGRLLTGWIVLPLNYQPTKKYPLVTHVHAGRTFTKAIMPDPASINYDYQTTNPQLLAAQGYAVLFPSMPLPPIGYVADPLLEHTKNVLPAVNKLIEMGIADPDKLAVMGCSYGGYTTYGLITQTNRFKAAIAIAGITNLEALWGIFEAHRRYYDSASELTRRTELSETGQGRMMNPPWKDYQRYIRNSPFSYVDRVSTPLLMIHGDMDNVAIQDVEMFFTGLYRQGKRARFVRYFGEGAHCSCQSPANNRHMAKEIYAWLDEFLDVSRDSAGNMIFKGDTVMGTAKAASSSAKANGSH